jgi:hypothetical protein
LVRDHGVGVKFNKFASDVGAAGQQAFCLNFANTIYFVAVSHTIDANSDTFLLIRKIITEEKPDVVLVEGVGNERGLNPPLGNWSGESYFATTVASANHIDYMGMEPSDNEVNKKLMTSYKKSDIIGMYFMRDYRYACKIAKKQKDEFITNFYQIYPKLGVTCKNWNHKEWFRDAFDKIFRYGAFLEYGASSTEKDAPITSKIAAAASRVRDIYCVKTIDELLGTKKKIVVIMGKNHAYAQFLALNNTFKLVATILPGR